MVYNLFTIDNKRTIITVIILTANELRRFGMNGIGIVLSVVFYSNGLTNLLCRVNFKDRMSSVNQLQFWHI